MPYRWDCARSCYFTSKNKYDFSHAVFNRNLLPFLIRKLDHILTVSQFSKNDIVHFAHVPSSKVTVTHLGVDHKKFTPPDDKVAIANWMNETYGVDGRYLLYISRLEHPGKNHVNLIKAFELFREQTDEHYYLVLPGPDKERADEIHAVANASKYVDDIKFLGFVDAKDVANLYRGASLFILPSFFEGFGLPVLEAMACGVPVITSNAASLPEVSGSLSPHFDPSQPEEITKAIIEVLADEKKRIALAEKGVEWASNFTWENTVDNTLGIFRQISNQRKN